MKIVLPKDEAVAALQADNAILKRTINSLNGKVGRLQRQLNEQKAEKEKIDRAKAFLRKIQSLMQDEGEALFGQYADGFF